MFPHFISAFIKKDDEVPLQTRGSIPREAFETKEDCIRLPLIDSENRIYVEEKSIHRALPTAGTSSLRQLDLQSLRRDDGPPTELRNRKQKFAKYEKDCSKVGDRLFVGGEVVAKSRDILQRCKITHVINCVGVLYPAYFEDELQYQTLYLQDSPKEDILAVLYDVFDFIEKAKGKGNVFVHCSQGVSRSMTLAIAYRMWKEERQYEDVFAEVKQMRGVANPNIGFICQLMQWHKRRTENPSSPNLYRIAPQSASAPTYLVPKWIIGSESTSAKLDSRGSFVLHSGRTVYLWKGSSILGEEFVSAARRFIQQLEKYETTDDIECLEKIIIEEGEENQAFWDALRHCLPEDANKGQNVSTCSVFDADYDMWVKSRFPTPSSQDRLSSEACDSARSGRKTPRAEANSFSPNDRLRKQARSDSFEDDYEGQRRNTANKSLGSSRRSTSPHILGLLNDVPNLGSLNGSPAADDEGPSPRDTQQSSSEELSDSSLSSDESDSEGEQGRHGTIAKRNMDIPKLNLG